MLYENPTYDLLVEDHHLVTEVLPVQRTGQPHRLACTRLAALRALGKVHSAEAALAELALLLHVPPRLDHLELGRVRVGAPAAGAATEHDAAWHSPKSRKTMCQPLCQTFESRWCQLRHNFTIYTAQTATLQTHAQKHAHLAAKPAMAPGIINPGSRAGRRDWSA